MEGEAACSLLCNMKTPEPHNIFDDDEVKPCSVADAYNYKFPVVVVLFVNLNLRVLM